MSTPRIQRWILERVLPPARRDEVLGDLTEGFENRRRRLGEGRARLWAWREVIGIVWWRIRERGATVVDDRRGRDQDREGVMGWVEDGVQDVQYAVRSLARRPGFTAAAVLVLGLGVGASTAVFSIIDRIFFDRPPLVEAPDRLVRIHRQRADGEAGALGNPDYQYYRSTVSSLDGLAAWSGPGLIASYSLDGVRFDQLDLERVSDNFFDVLGVRPVLGREFRPEENATPGAHPVVVLGHGFWERALGADPAVVGSTITLNGRAWTVIGVMPEGWRGIQPGSAPADAWVPIAMTGELENPPDDAWWRRHPGSVSTWLNVVGRLADGVTFEQAEAEFEAAWDNLETPEKGESEGVWVRRQWLYMPSVEAELTGLSAILVGVVAIVLGVAATNVALLLLSRASTRTGEIAVRAALGASRGRIARHLLAECLVLGAGGAVLGIGLARILSDLAADLLPIALAGGLAPDGRVTLAGVLLAALTSLAVGLVPTLHATRGGLSGTIRRGPSSPDRGRARAILIVGQLALSVVLIAGALLFTRSFQAARGQDVGFVTDHRLVVRVDLRALAYDEERLRTFARTALERIEAVPGVDAATTTWMVPFRGRWTSTVETPPDGTPNAGTRTRMGRNVVSPGYFEIMGMPLLSGRGFGAGDTPSGPFVTVVNEALARATWPGQDAVGKSLMLRPETPFTVVGVVADANYYELGEEPVPHAWTTLEQSVRDPIAFVVETTVPPATVAVAVQSAIRDVEPAVPVSAVTTLEQQVSEQVARYEVTAVLVGFSGIVALILAAVGLYGVIAFLVSRRTREIGVRIALGADRARVARAVVASSSRLALMGGAVGLVGAVALRRFTTGFLYGVPPDDPLPLAGAALSLALVAVVASWIPARQATRIDPVVSLKSD